MARKLTLLLKNKYLLVTLVFAVWVGFFDRNDLITQWHLRSNLKELRQKKQYYIHQIALTNQERNQLVSSPAKLEQFAREKYLMKKDGEDLFLVQDSTKIQP